MKRRIGDTNHVAISASSAEKPTRSSFRAMLHEVRTGMEMSQQDFAARLGYSPQHLCDLESGRRMPSVAFVERLCEYLCRGPLGRREWHVAGAQAHGWQVDMVRGLALELDRSAA